MIVIIMEVATLPTRYIAGLQELSTVLGLSSSAFSGQDKPKQI